MLNDYVDYFRILREKTDYIKKYNLGGAMVWSIETDDFRGKCGKEWPLLNVLYEELGSGAPSSTKKSSQLEGEALKQSSYEPQTPQQPQEPEQSEWSEAPQPQQHEEPQEPAFNVQLCQTEGYVRDPQDCNKFYYCQYFDNAFVEIPFNCPASLFYNTKTGVCEWPANVQC